MFWKRQTNWTLWWTWMNEYSNTVMAHWHKYCSLWHKIPKTTLLRRFRFVQQWTRAASAASNNPLTVAFQPRSSLSGHVPAAQRNMGTGTCINSLLSKQGCSSTAATVELGRPEDNEKRCNTLGYTHETHTVSIHKYPSSYFSHSLSLTHTNKQAHTVSEQMLADRYEYMLVKRWVNTLHSCQQYWLSP